MATKDAVQKLKNDLGPQEDRQSLKFPSISNNPGTPEKIVINCITPSSGNQKFVKFKTRLVATEKVKGLTYHSEMISGEEGDIKVTRDKILLFNKARKDAYSKLTEDKFNEQEERSRSMNS